MGGGIHQQLLEEGKPHPPGAPVRGSIVVPRALNQAFKIINLITLSILLLSLQLLVFRHCWKGQTQPHISLKATHAKQQDDTSQRNNYFGHEGSEPVQRTLLPHASPTPWTQQLAVMKDLWEMSPVASCLQMCLHPVTHCKLTHPGPTCSLDPSSD